MLHLVHSNKEFDDKKNCLSLFVNVFNLSFCCYMTLVKMKLFFNFKAQKIPTKVLMCSCNVNKFHQEENEYIKKLCHFYCHCRDEHQTFVYTCKVHPFIAARAQGMESRCSCAKKGPTWVFDFCIQVKYFINFGAYKICLKSIPENFQQHLVSLDRYLEEEITFCKIFFYFSNKKVNILLDNPLETYMEDAKVGMFVLGH